MSEPLLVRAARGEVVERVPVWLMRQAGRFLPEYRAVRDRHDFLEVVTTPELAALVSLQPWRRFAPDGVIMFSDILTPLTGMGIPFTLDEGGPRILEPIQTAADVARVRVADPRESTPYVLELIRGLRQEVGDGAAVLGFAGAPFTLAWYAVGTGRHRKESAVKTLAYVDPSTLHALLTKLADQAALYLEAQVEAGAQVVQLFDTWAGELGERDYREFALPYQSRAIAGVIQRVPVILYVLGGRPDLLKLSGATIVSLDWRVDLSTARAALGAATVLQGNLDPAVLFGPARLVEERTRIILEAGAGRNHIFNLGHGLLPTTPVASVATVIDTVKAWRPR